MTLLLPGSIVSEPLVRERGQTESSVADPDVLSIIGHDLRRDIDQLPLLFGHHLSSAMMTVHENELVDTVGSVGFSHRRLLNRMVKRFLSLRNHVKQKMAVGLSDEAS
jgi:hypothetical protein